MKKSTFILQPSDVFRIEDRLRFGPYDSILWKSSQAQKDLVLDHRHSVLVPNSYFDFNKSVVKVIDSNSFNHRFACPSLKILISWFDGWFHVLKENGFFVARLEVPAYHLGKSKRQVIYREDWVQKRTILEWDHVLGKLV